MGITYGDHLIDSGYYELTEEQEREMEMNRGYSTPNSGPPARFESDPLLLEALGLLHRFALEQTGWRGWLKRWYYSDEPLRHDAANLIRRAGYMTMTPGHCQLVGAPYNSHPID